MGDAGEHRCYSAMGGQGPPGWRRRGNISWRATSWDLRRMTTGGMRLDNFSPEERRAAGLALDVMALRARHVGQYGAHAVAKNAGFVKGDVLVAVGNETGPLSESQLMAWLVNANRPGAVIPVVILRDGQRMTLALPMQ